MLIDTYVNLILYLNHSQVHYNDLLMYTVQLFVIWSILNESVHSEDNPQINWQTHHS